MISPLNRAVIVPSGVFFSVLLDELAIIPGFLISRLLITALQNNRNQFLSGEVWLIPPMTANHRQPVIYQYLRLSYPQPDIAGLFIALTEADENRLTGKIERGQTT